MGVSGFKIQVRDKVWDSFLRFRFWSQVLDSGLGLRFGIIHVCDSGLGVRF